MYPYDSMGRGFCQDDWEGKFVGVGCEVIVGESSLLILLCKPFREASESENCVSNGFHNFWVFSPLHNKWIERDDFPRWPPYFTGKVLPCCIIDGTKCHCTGGMEPCVQWHFLNKHYLLNLCFMYSLAFNSRVSSSGASGSIWPYLRSRAVCNIKSQSTGFFGKREPCE